MTRAQMRSLYRQHSEWHVGVLQNEDARQELHALGFVDGHEGQQSLSLKFYLQKDTQAGNDMGLRR